MEQVNRHSQILGPDTAVVRAQETGTPDNGRTERERKPSVLDRLSRDSGPGMPFHWAMAFAFLVFVAMWVAFWCGHHFSVTSMEKFISKQPAQPAPAQYIAPTPAPAVIPSIVQKTPKPSAVQAQLDEEAVTALAQVITERLDRRAREQQDSLRKMVGSMSNNSTNMQALTETFTGELNDVDTQIASVQQLLQQIRDRNQAELDTIQKAVNENSDSTRADLGRLRKEFNDRLTMLDGKLGTLAQVVRSKIQHPDEVKLNSFGTEFPPKEEPAKQ